MNNIFKIFLTVLLFISSSCLAAPITNLRSSVNADKVRLVLDSTQPIAYKVEKTDKEILVDLTNSSAKNMRLAIKSEAVKNAILISNGKNTSRLQIPLAQASDYKIFTLTKPHRLVIDVLLVQEIHKQEKLAEGVVYKFDQTTYNGKRMRSYLLEIKKDSPYELVPFSCAGKYNGRGYLAKASSNNKMLAAINSSYFDTDGWVIGNTKYNGQFISSDDQKRSAYAAYKKNHFIFKDVSYRGVVKLPNGKTANLFGMNRQRIANDFVLYNEYFAPSTKTNAWGIEVKVKNNKVIAVSNKGNMFIEPGTYVLSAHGTAKSYLAGIKPGDRITLEESLSHDNADKMETVISGGPLLLEKGVLNVRIEEEKIAADIAQGRAPRTALGLKKDGTILLLVVDGRSKASAGLTLYELAQYLKKLGAYDALNFDGGGSSEMVIKGKVMNNPSDGHERAVSMGLGLVKSAN